MADGTTGGNAGSTEAAAKLNDKELTRRQLLTKATIGVGGVMGTLLVGGPTLAALAPAVQHEDFPRIDLGAVDDFRTSEGKYQKITLELAPKSADPYVSKLVAYVRWNGAKPKADSLTGVKDEFTILSNRCAHLGCPVQNSGDTFVCPCHGGQYGGDGERTGGPPVRPLDRFQWELAGDRLMVVDLYSLTNGGKRVKHAGPGQHTSGPESWLYPLHP